MIILYWAISQILSYGVPEWGVFLAVAAGAAFTLRWPGVVVGQVVIAGMIVVQDVRWIQSEIHKPSWNGQPDQDFVFIFGVLCRILLINTVLLPVSGVMLRLREYLRAVGG